MTNTAMAEGHEQVLLAAMMNGTDELPVTAEDFSSPPNRTIFKTITRLTKRGLLAVTDALRLGGELDNVGGHHRITGISQMPHDAASVQYALDCVLEDARERRAAKIGAQLHKGEISYYEASEQLAALHSLDGTGLCVRSAREILDMELDENDCLFGDRLLTKSGKLVIAGEPGIGKSRILLQFAACSIRGLPCLGIGTHARGMRWLIFQTENSNRRLKTDIGWLVREYGEEFLDHLFVRLLDGELLSLLKPAAIEAEIRKIQPGIVGWDPLKDVAIGDLNSDADMTETVVTIERICRRGDLTRGIAVLHHALTGKAGAAKSTGWERAGFARNSKMLLAWARAQINVAPGGPEKDDPIVLTCGKNNDGKQFPQFAARLNPKTMIYEVDENFDIEGWRQEVSSAKPPRKSAKDVLRDILQPGREYDQKDIVARVIEEELVSPATAYRIINEGKTGRILRRNKVTKTYALV